MLRRIPVLYLALLLAAPGACHRIAPPEPPVPPTGGSAPTGGTSATGGATPASGGQGTGGTATGGASSPSTAELLCDHLAELRCPEAGAGCVDQAQALLDLQAEGRVRFDVVCLSEATTQEQARSCGSVLCGGDQ
jgi:hypothetical protein